MFQKGTKCQWKIVIAETHRSGHHDNRDNIDALQDNWKKYCESEDFTFFEWHYHTKGFLFLKLASSFCRLSIEPNWCVL